MSQTDLIQTIVNATRTRLDQQVAAGRLTRQQADEIIQRVQQNAPQMITRTGLPGPGGPGGGPRAGGEGRGPGAGQSPAR